MVVANAVMSRPDFLAAVRRVGDERYHHKHPFHLRLHRGELSRDEFQLWVRNRFYYQTRIPIKDAAILANMPSREHRRRWVARILNHDGTERNPGGIEKWIRLGESVGLGRSDLFDEETVLPGVRFAVDSYVHFCRDRSWYEAVAASLTELFAPDLIAKRMDSMRHHYPWIQPEGFEYFTSRMTLAPQDAQEALELVVEHTRSGADQALALSALVFKCDVLWSMLDAIDCSARKLTSEVRDDE